MQMEESENKCQVESVSLLTEDHFSAGGWTFEEGSCKEHVLRSKGIVICEACVLLPVLQISSKILKCFAVT